MFKMPVSKAASSTLPWLARLRTGHGIHVHHLSLSAAEWGITTVHILHSCSPSFVGSDVHIYEMLNKLYCTRSALWESM